MYNIGFKIDDWSGINMQTNTVAMKTHVSPMLNAISQEVGNPVLDRLITEVRNQEHKYSVAYDRVHNRHNRGGN